MQCSFWRCFGDSGRRFRFSPSSLHPSGPVSRSSVTHLDTMRWSRSHTGPCGHTAGNHSLYPRRPNRTDPQDTYICCAYSPRCFIIQKVNTIFVFVYSLLFSQRAVFIPSLWLSRCSEAYHTVVPKSGLRRQFRVYFIALGLKRKCIWMQGRKKIFSSLNGP